MAKTNYTVDSILEVVSTGLDGEDLVAFKAFCAAELGAFQKLVGTDQFGGLTLSGKGDKAKGTYKGATIAFSGGHNAATIVLHFGCRILKEAASLNVNPPTVDCSELCRAWKERRERAGKHTVAA